MVSRDVTFDESSPGKMLKNMDSVEFDDFSDDSVDGENIICVDVDSDEV